MRRGRCRSCHRPILWGVTERGRSIPLDVDPADDGNVELNRVTDDAIVHGRTPYAPRGGAWSLHKSHFATCPQADKHRRPA